MTRPRLSLAFALVAIAAIPAQAQVMPEPDATEVAKTWYTTEPFHKVLRPHLAKLLHEFLRLCKAL